MTRWTVPANGRHTSGYGPRNTGIPGASTFHRGHDIAPPTPGQRGVTVHAVGPGRVAAVDYNSARGRFVRVRHDDGSMTLYQHLDRTDVAMGQRVATGQRIGLMGDTGIGAGVHLHFECYEAGVNAHVLANAVDPVAYLARRGVRLVPASTVSRPLPTGGGVPTAPIVIPPTPLTPEEPMSRENAMLGVYDALEAGAKRADPTGRQIGDFLAAIIRPVVEAEVARATSRLRYLDTNSSDARDAVLKAVREVPERTWAAQIGTGSNRRTVATALARLESAAARIEAALAGLPTRVWGFKRKAGGPMGRGPDRIDMAAAVGDLYAKSIGKTLDRAKHPNDRTSQTDF